jgi:ABC-type antimicrobial peptide transport system permease subunit
MALGATPRDIAALVLRMGTLVIGLGTAVGLVGYLALSRLVAAHLFNTPSMDPATLASATLSLAAVSFAACLLPALRATRVEPVVALRNY